MNWFKLLLKITFSRNSMIKIWALLLLSIFMNWFNMSVKITFFWETMITNSILVWLFVLMSWFNMFLEITDHNINICVLFHSNDPIQLVPENCSFFSLCPINPLTGFKMVAVIHFGMKMPKLPLSLIYTFPW